MNVHGESRRGGGGGHHSYSACGDADAGSRGRVIQPDDVRANQSTGEHSAWSRLTEEACFHSNAHGGRGMKEERVKRLHADSGKDETEKGNRGDYENDLSKIE